MELSSFNTDLNYSDERVVTKVVLESPFSKEIRILMKAGQLMKEHKTKFPIVVQLLEGTLDFGVQGETYSLQKGDILALDPNVPHDLKAKTDSIVRLTLSKYDSAERVENVTKS